MIPYLEPFIDALLMEVMTARFECSYLLSHLKLTHTHHTAERGIQRERWYEHVHNVQYAPKKVNKSTGNGKGTTVVVPLKYRSVPLLYRYRTVPVLLLTFFWRVLYVMYTHTCTHIHVHVHCTCTCTCVCVYTVKDTLHTMTQPQCIPLVVSISLAVCSGWKSVDL